MSAVIVTTPGPGHRTDVSTASSRSLLAPRGSKEPLSAGPPVLALGFRPFFLAAGVLAVVLVPLWLLVFFGKVPLPSAFYPSAWHGHEMVFGFAVAVIAGFLLTAAKNWTGVQTVSGASLGLLVALFVLGRVAVFASATLPRVVVALVDVAFLPAVAVALAVPIVRAKNWRNLGFVPLLLVLSAANALFHADSLRGSTALRFAIDVILVIVVLMGGRVIPMFTANALKVEIRKNAILDWTSLASVAAVALLELLPVDARALGVAAVVAGLLSLVRLVGWRPLATRGHPILWVLHIGYAFLAVGLVLKGLVPFIPSWIATAPLHALAIGAIALLILGMATRVSLGHTGRMLAVSPPIVLAYVALILSAALRSVGPLISPSSYVLLLIASGVAWTLSFAIFTFVYLPILIAPRVDGKPG